MSLPPHPVFCYPASILFDCTKGEPMQRGKPAKKYSQAARVHDIVRLIEARHGITIEELAEETGVDRRTIHRDLNAIHDAGYPLVSDWLDGRKAYRFIT